FCVYFFFIHLLSTEIYTLSLHDALPIFFKSFLNVAGSNKFSIFPEERRIVDSEKHTHRWLINCDGFQGFRVFRIGNGIANFKTLDRKSTRLNSSHVKISYAVFCLKKKIK